MSAAPSTLAEAVKDDVERALGDDARIELLERTGRGVARIGKVSSPAALRSAFSFSNPVLVR